MAEVGLEPHSGPYNHWELRKTCSIGRSTARSEAKSVYVVHNPFTQFSSNGSPTRERGS